MDNETFIDMLQLALETNHAPLTVKSYNAEIGFFSKFLKSTTLAKATPEHGVNYFRHVRAMKSVHDGTPLASKTIKRKILTLFSIYEDAITLDLVLHNPFIKAARLARNIKIEYKREPRHVDFKKVAYIVKSAATLRDKAIFAILFGGGLRVSELVGLKVRDIADIGGLIGLTVKTAKTNKLRPVRLPAWSSEIVRNYAEGVESNWLFPSKQGGGKDPLTRKWVSNLCFKAFGMRAHSARHTHASYLLDKGVPIVDVGRALGHDCIRSTMAYDRRIMKFDTSASSKADFLMQ